MFCICSANPAAVIMLILGRWKLSFRKMAGHPSNHAYPFGKLMTSISIQHYLNTSAHSSSMWYLIRILIQTVIWFKWLWTMIFFSHFRKICSALVCSSVQYKQCVCCLPFCCRSFCVHQGKALLQMGGLISPETDPTWRWSGLREWNRLQ